VVAVIEGDGVLQPLEVGRRSRVNRVDFLELALPLAHCESGHTPSKDQETILDLGETVPFVIVVLVLWWLLPFSLGGASE
jgi:hypothetical protein